MAKQGASRGALKERKDDLHETHPMAVHALLRVEDLPPFIWEPCAGRGAIARVLMDAGFHVKATDLVAHNAADSYIETGIDFLMEQRAPAKGCAIVTNPPYKLDDEFIRHGLNLGCSVIVLLRLMAIEGVKRSDLNDVYLHRIWAGKERLPMMHRDGWDGPKIDTSGVPFGWFVYLPRPRGDAPIELRRMSWRS